MQHGGGGAPLVSLLGEAMFPLCSLNSRMDLRSKDQQRKPGNQSTGLDSWG